MAALPQLLQIGLLIQQGVVGVLGLVVPGTYPGQQGIVLLLCNGHSVCLQLDLLGHHLGPLCQQLLVGHAVLALQLPQGGLLAQRILQVLVGLQLLAVLLCKGLCKALSGLGSLSLGSRVGRARRNVIDRFLVVVSECAEVACKPALSGRSNVIHAPCCIRIRRLDTLLARDERRVLNGRLKLLPGSLNAISQGIRAAPKRVHFECSVDALHLVLHQRGRLVQRLSHAAFHFGGSVVAFVVELLPCFRVAHSQHRALEDVLRIAHGEVTWRVDAPEVRKDGTDAGGHVQHGRLCLRQRALVADAFRQSQRYEPANFGHDLGWRMLVEVIFHGLYSGIRNIRTGLLHLCDSVLVSLALSEPFGRILARTSHLLVKTRHEAVSMRQLVEERREWVLPLQPKQVE